MSEPAFPLPDLPRAPYSDVGALAYGFLSTADWSAVPPLLDALREADRHGDVDEVRRIIRGAVQNTHRTNSTMSPMFSADEAPWWAWFECVSRLLELFFWDVYDFDCSLRLMGETLSISAVAAAREVSRTNLPNADIMPAQDGSSANNEIVIHITDVPGQPPPAWSEYAPGTPYGPPQE